MCRQYTTAMGACVQSVLHQAVELSQLQGIEEPRSTQEMLSFDGPEKGEGINRRILDRAWECNCCCSRVDGMDPIVFTMRPSGCLDLGHPLPYDFEVFLELFRGASVDNMGELFKILDVGGSSLSSLSYQRARGTLNRAMLVELPSLVRTG